MLHCGKDIYTQHQLTINMLFPFHLFFSAELFFLEEVVQTQKAFLHISRFKIIIYELKRNIFETQAELLF